MTLAQPVPEQRVVPPELEPVLAAIHRVRGVLTPEMMRVWLDLNVTLAQFQVLFQIWRHGRRSGRQLADQLGVTPGAVVGLSDRLEELGYVVRERDRADRRISWLMLTPAGEEMFARITSVPRSRLGPALAGLSAADRDDLARVLNHLAAALEAGGGDTIDRRRSAVSGEV
jgi:DNA-binding MarR family transcriptional regulator